MRIPMPTPASAANVKPAKRRIERVQGMMRQNAVERQLHEGGGDGLERRKELRREQPEMRHRLPQRADHDERKRIARKPP